MVGSLPSKIVVTPESVLTHDFEIEDRVSRATPDDTIKGMFFQRIVDMVQKLGMSPPQITLESTPMRTRYLAFYDYPVSDYFRLVHAVAGQLHPREAASEGIRRVGGADFAGFARSKLGRVMLAFTGSATTTLARSAAMYAAVLKGSAKITTEEIPGGVCLQYRNYPGLAEVYPIGTIESTCRHYSVDYEIEIDVHSPWDADYTVHMGRQGDRR